ETDRKNIEIILDDYFRTKINIQKETRNNYEYSKEEVKDWDNTQEDILNKLDKY
ncbi:XRE family transcriptional regulator, partial [Staphylococcus arlettae]